MKGVGFDEPLYILPFDHRGSFQTKMFGWTGVLTAEDNVGCIVLGRGEDDKKVHEWLSTAAAVPGFIGFAVGRTVFWDPLVGWRAGKSTRGAAVTEIARRYGEFVDVFEKGRAA